MRKSGLIWENHIPELCAGVLQDTVTSLLGVVTVGGPTVLETVNQGAVINLFSASY